MTLLPRVVSKLALVTSGEYMKSKECIQGVVFETKKLQLLESLKLLEIAMMEGKLERLTNQEVLDEQMMKWWQNKYDTQFSDHKKKEIDKIFSMFDADSSNSIDEQEMQEVLESMGFDKKSPQGQAAKKIMKLVDRDGGGTIDKDEFKVLMAMALDHQTPEQMQEDMTQLFKKFDTDQSDSLSIEELRDSFEGLGVSMDLDGMAELVFMVFKDHRRSLDREGFVEFLMKLQELAENR